MPLKYYLETWAEIPGYDNYSVSNLGNIWSKKTKKYLTPCDRHKNHVKMKKGYMAVNLSLKGKAKMFSVHSLVLLAFKGERPSGYVINHIDGNPSNNALYNLEYCTQSHNRKQDFINGRQSFIGEKNNQSKITEDDVKYILELKKQGYTYKEIAKKFNMSESGIGSIFTGHTWKHLTGIKNGA